MISLLIVEDDIIVGNLIVKCLEKDGIETILVRDGETAWELLRHQLFDLVLIDIGLPGMDGLQLVAQIRGEEKLNRTALIFLSQRDQVNDKIIGLDIGADDYIAKPFDMDELMARIRAALRNKQKVDVASETHILTYDTIKLDLIQRQVWVDGYSKNLTAKEFDLLRLLVKKAENVVTKREIENAVLGGWGLESRKLIAQHIKNIKKKMLVDNKECIVIDAVRGIGYKLYSAFINKC